MVFGPSISFNLMLNCFSKSFFSNRYRYKEEYRETHCYRCPNSELSSSSSSSPFPFEGNWARIVQYYKMVTAHQLDCEQSLFSSKIRGKEWKTGKRASVTVTWERRCREPLVAWALGDE